MNVGLQVGDRVRHSERGWLGTVAAVPQGENVFRCLIRWEIPEEFRKTMLDPNVSEGWCNLDWLVKQ